MRSTLLGQTLVGLLAFFCLSDSLAQEIWPGGTPGVGGSYNLSVPPTVNRQIGNGMTGAIRRTNNYEGPFQTHNWWNSALWDMPYLAGFEKSPHSSPMYPHPLTIDAEPDGIRLSYNTEDYQGGDNQTSNFLGGYDLRISTGSGTTNATEVNDYGDWHVQLSQNFGGTELLTTMGKGSPFVFVETDGSNVSLTNEFGTNMEITAIFENAIAFTTSPNAACYPDKNYAIFLPPGGTINGQSASNFSIGQNINSLSLTMPSGTRKCTIALLPDGAQSTLELFEPYAYCIVRESVFTYDFQPEVSLVSSLFNTTTEAYGGHDNIGTMHCLYRHQFLWSYEASSGANTGLTYICPRGEMQLITGDFSTEMKHYGLLPHLAPAAAENIDISKVEAELDYIVNYPHVVNHRSANNDSYNDFQLASKLAKAAEIAHAIGRTDYRDQCLDAAKRIVEDYFTSPNGEEYNTTYSTDFNWMAHYRNSFNSDVGMHDAHFVDGFIIYAAATIARFEEKRFGNRNWINEWQPMVDLVIRNIDDYERNTTAPGNNEPWFPYLRFFDPYSGHSWFANYSEAQEAISESIHFAAGAMLWGELTENMSMRNMGAMLFTVEAEAGRQYWFDVDQVGSNAALAPTAGCPNGDGGYAYQHAGIIFQWGSTYGTFFGTDPHEIHGITYWPISGHSVWMGVNPAGLEAAHADFGGAFNFSNTPPFSHWPVELLCAEALFDPNNAFDLYENNIMQNGSPFRTPNNVQSRLWAIEGYHWTGTLDSVGILNADVNADHPYYSVFEVPYCDDNWIRHYMVYNPPTESRKTVTFTEGTCWDVPSDTLVTFKLYGPDKTGRLTASANEVCNDETLTLTYSDFTVCDGDTTVEYQYSVDNGPWQSLFRIESAGDSLKVSFTPTQVGEVRYRAIMLNEYLDQPEMLCDLNDFPTDDQIATVDVQACGCFSPTFATLSFIGNDTICEDDTTQLMVTSDANQGFLYQWFETTSGIEIVAPEADISSISLSTPGTFSTLISDPLNPSCIVWSDTLELVQIQCPCHAPTFASVVLTGPDTLCEDDTVRLEVLSDAPAGFLFSWVELNQKDTIVDQMVDITSIEVSDSGRFMALIQDPDRPECFIYSDTIQLFKRQCACLAPTFASLLLTGPDTLCEDDKVRLEVLTDAPAGFLFSWVELNQNNTIISEGEDISSIEVSDSGRFVALIEDPDRPECFNYSDTIQLFKRQCACLAPTVASLSLAGLDTICENQNTTAILATDLPQSNLVTWFHVASSSIIAGPAENLLSLNLDSAGRYVTFVEDTERPECFLWSDTIEVFSKICACPGPYSAELTSSVSHLCNGDSAELALSTDAPLTHLFSWTMLSTSPSNLASEVGLTQIQTTHNGDFQVTITDPVRPACSYLSNVLSITEHSPQVIDFTIVHPTCENSNGIIILEGFSNSNPVNLTWQSSQNTSESRLLNPNTSGIAIIDNLEAGTYGDLHILSSQGCRDTVFSSVELQSSPPPNFYIIDSQNPMECEVNNGNITVGGLISGESYILSISEVPQPFTLTASTNGTSLIENLEAGVYSEFILSSKGCSYPLDTTISLSSPDAPQIAIASENPSACLAQDGLLSFNSLEPGTSYTYAFDGPSGTIENTATVSNNSILVEGLAVGTYENFTLSAAGCTSFSDVSISLIASNSSPTITFTHPSSVCAMSTSIEVTVDSDLPIDNWEWDIQAANNVSVTNQRALLNASVTDIPISVRATADCIDTTVSTTINIIPLDTLEVLALKTTLCPGECISLGSSTDATVHWVRDGVSIDQASSISACQGGAYSFLPIGSHECFISFPALQIEESFIDLTINPEEMAAFDGESVVFEANSSSQGDFTWWSSQELIAETATLDWIVQGNDTLTISFMDETGCEISETVSVTLLEGIQIPSAFTPNGDGTNEKWNITGLVNLGTSHLAVYNRWGNLVYSSDAGEAWDGRIRGKLLPVGTYYYILQIEGESDRTGTVTIVR